MKPEKLAYMANQIATAFAHLPEAEALTSIAAHIDAFWDPRMRAQLLEMVEARNPDLSPLVVAASERVRPPSPA